MEGSAVVTVVVTEAVSAVGVVVDSAAGVDLAEVVIVEAEALEAGEMTSVAGEGVDLVVAGATEDAVVELASKAAADLATTTRMDSAVHQMEDQEDLRGLVVVSGAHPEVALEGMVHQAEDMEEVVVVGIAETSSEKEVQEDTMIETRSVHATRVIWSYVFLGRIKPCVEANDVEGDYTYYTVQALSKGHASDDPQFLLFLLCFRPVYGALHPSRKYCRFDIVLSKQVIWEASMYAGGP